MEIRKGNVCHVSTEQFLLLLQMSQAQFSALLYCFFFFCLKGLNTCTETQIGNLSQLSGNKQWPADNGSSVLLSSFCNYIKGTGMALACSSIEDLQGVKNVLCTLVLIYISRVMQSTLFQAVVIAGVALDGAESYNYIGYTVFKA